MVQKLKNKIKKPIKYFLIKTSAHELMLMSGPRLLFNCFTLRS